MNILVTGGAGYLGAVLVPALLQAGHKVCVLDNFMYNQQSLLDCCHHPKLHIVRGDARDKNIILPLVQEANVIIPLACLTGAPLCDKEPRMAQEVIIDALRLILNHRKKRQIIIYPTTNSGYGVGEKDKLCTEETPLRPVSLYGRLKVQAEKEVLEAGGGITLRLATVFGISPRMRLDLLVNNFTYRAVTEGKIELYEGHFRRNFIHVQDVARVFLHCLGHFDKMKNQTYNVGLSHANLSKRELCEEIKKQIPSLNITESHTGKDPDQRDYIVSNKKIEKTGFKPKVSLAQGIQELIKGFSVIHHRKVITTHLTNI